LFGRTKQAQADVGFTYDFWESILKNPIVIVDIIQALIPGLPLRPPVALVHRGAGQNEHPFCSPVVLLQG